MLLRMASRQNWVKYQASHSRKQQIARPLNVHWWLSHQRPVRVGLHCQARCSYHPWRQSGLYGLNLQLDNGGGSSHTCPPFDCLKRWQSDHTCHPHGFKKVKSRMGSPDWDVSMVDIHLWKFLWVYCPGHAGVKGNDRADRLVGKATLTSGLLLRRS